MISIDNQLDYVLNDAENNKRFNDKLVSSNMGYGLGWKVKWNKNTTQNTKAFFSDYKLNYNFITREGDVRFQILKNEIPFLIQEYHQKLSSIDQKPVSLQLDINTHSKMLPMRF